MSIFPRGPCPRKSKPRSPNSFWLHENKDALYGAGGGPGRRDPTGHSGTDVGHEIDMTVVWKIDHHQNIVLGWSHFFQSDFIQGTGSSVDADLFYLQHAFKF
ncbi:MAG: alginate export family protein [Planctomycetes bacterium]|nr:alginate export family protein [Planctomycetota bacterium]